MSFIQVPPDSTGKRVLTKYHATQDAYVQGTHLVDHSDPTRGQRIDPLGAAFVRYSDGSPQFDSFGRSIISRTKAKYNLEFSCGCPPRGVYYWVEGGASHEIEASGAMVLRTTTAADSRLAMQTNQHFRYTPGYSTSYVFTLACADSGKENVIRRIGAFDDLDGLFFQIGANGLSIGIKNSIDSTERLIPQADFNGDRLDGTGISGYTLNLTKDNIYWIDFQWLGAGAVSFGMFIDGQKIVLHREGHFNQLDHSYMRSGSRPFRVEQRNTGLAGSSSEFRFFCLAVIGDASSHDVEFQRQFPISVSGTYNTAGDIHMVSVRPSQLNLAGNVNRRKVGALEAIVSGLSATPGVFAIKLIRDAVITGGTWDAVGGVIEVNKTATFTGGLTVYQTIVKTAGDVMRLKREDGEIPLLVRKADPSETETFTIAFERLRGDSIEVDASFIFADGV